MWKRSSGMRNKGMMLPRRSLTPGRWTTSWCAACGWSCLIEGAAANCEAQSRAGKEHLKKLSGTSDQRGSRQLLFLILRSLSGGSPISSKQSPPYLGTPGAGIPRLLPCFSSPNGTRCAGLRLGPPAAAHSSLRTAMKASVGSWTVPRVRIFFLPAPRQTSLPGVPKWIQMLGRSEFALRQGFAFGNACTSQCAAPPCGVEGRRKCRYSSSSLRTAIKASVGSCTVPRVRIFFLPSFCFSSSFFFRVMSPP